MEFSSRTLADAKKELVEVQINYYKMKIKKLEHDARLNEGHLINQMKLTEHFSALVDQNAERAIKRPRMETEECPATQPSDVFE
jgi:hypothetical protein